MLDYLKSDAGYWTVGSVLGAVGLYFLLRGLIGWRARGRPRCWKCRYDMTGAAGLGCPECGYVNRNEKYLTKTRRLWKRAIFGAMLCLMCSYMLGYPQIHFRRDKLGEPWYTAVVPTTAFIMLLPSLNEWDTFTLDNRLFRERERAFAPSMTVVIYDDGTFSEWDDGIDMPARSPAGVIWIWQESLLRWRCRSMLSDEKTLRLPPTDNQLWLPIYWLGATSAGDADAARLIRPALRSSDETVRRYAAHSLGSIGVSEETVVDALSDAVIKLLQRPGKNPMIEFRAMTRLRPVTERLAEHMADLFESDSAVCDSDEIRAWLGDNREKLLPLLLRRLDDYAARRDAWLEQLKEGDEDEFDGDDFGLMQGLAMIGKPAVAPMLQRLTSPNMTLQSDASTVLEWMDPPPAEALPRLREMLANTGQGDDDRNLRITIEYTIREIEANLAKANGSPRQ